MKTTEPVFCSRCNCNPCMCGKQNYRTEKENRSRNEKTPSELCNDPDAWALRSETLGMSDGKEY